MRMHRVYHLHHIYRLVFFAKLIAIGKSVSSESSLFGSSPQKDSNASSRPSLSESTQAGASSLQSHQWHCRRFQRSACLQGESTPSTHSPTAPQAPIPQEVSSSRRHRSHCRCHHMQSLIPQNRNLSVIGLKPAFKSAAYFEQTAPPSVNAPIGASRSSSAISSQSSSSPLQSSESPGAAVARVSSQSALLAHMPQ